MRLCSNKTKHKTKETHIGRMQGSSVFYALKKVKCVSEGDTENGRGVGTRLVWLMEFLDIPIVFEPLSIPGFGWESLQHLWPQGPGKTVQVLGGDPWALSSL